jgi:predicted RNA-binding protein Jag
MGVAFDKRPLRANKNVNANTNHYQYKNRRRIHCEYQFPPIAEFGRRFIRTALRHYFRGISTASNGQKPAREIVNPIRSAAVVSHAYNRH